LVGTVAVGEAGQQARNDTEAEESMYGQDHGQVSPSYSQDEAATSSQDMGAAVRASEAKLISQFAHGLASLEAKLAGQIAQQEALVASTVAKMVPELASFGSELENAVSTALETMEAKLESRSSSQEARREITLQAHAGLEPEQQVQSLAATLADHIDDFSTARAELSLAASRHDRELQGMQQAIERLECASALSRASALSKDMLPEERLVKVRQLVRQVLRKKQLVPQAWLEEGPAPPVQPSALWHAQSDAEKMAEAVRDALDHPGDAPTPVALPAPDDAPEDAVPPGAPGSSEWESRLQIVRRLVQQVLKLKPLVPMAWLPPPEEEELESNRRSEEIDVGQVRRALAQGSSETTARRDVQDEGGENPSEAWGRHFDEFEERLRAISAEVADLEAGALPPMTPRPALSSTRSSGAGSTR